MAEYIDLDTPLELKVVWGSTYKPYTSTLRELLDVNHIPYTAADVRPVVKAKWTDHRTIEHDGEWYCTACGKEITIYMGADRKDRYNFCPNCGADMREES